MIGYGREVRVPLWTAAAPLVGSRLRRAALLGVRPEAQYMDRRLAARARLFSAFVARTSLLVAATLAPQLRPPSRSAKHRSLTSNPCHARP